MCPLKVCILQKWDTGFFIYLLHQAKYCVDSVTHFLPPDLDLSDPPDLSPDKRRRENMLKSPPMIKDYFIPPCNFNSFYFIYFEVIVKRY